MVTAGVLVLAVVAGLSGCSAGSGIGGSTPDPVRETVTVVSSQERAERFAAEVVAAALRRAGHEARTKTAGDVAEALRQPGPVVSLVFDVDLLEHRKPGGYTGVTAGDLEAEVRSALPAPYNAMEFMRLTGRDVLVYRDGKVKRETIERRLAEPSTAKPSPAPTRPGPPVRGGPVRALDPGGDTTVVVRDTLGTGLRGALERAYPWMNLSLQPVGGMSEGLRKGTIPVAIVPDTVKLGDGYRRSEIPGEVLPGRTLLALGSKDLGEPALRVVRDIAQWLSPEEIRAAVSSGADLPQAAGRSISQYGVLPAVEPSRSCTGTCERQLGFTAFLFVLLGVMIGVALMVLAGVARRKATAGARGRHGRGDEETSMFPVPAGWYGTPPRQEAGGVPGRDWRPAKIARRSTGPPGGTSPAPPIVASPTPETPRATVGQDGEADLTAPLVVGKPPNPARVRLPDETTSARAGIAVDGGMLGETTVRAATVRGRSHAHRGDFRQDAYGMRLSTDGNWVIVAVADGLGSAANSDTAANVAVRAALAEIDHALTAAEAELATGPGGGTMVRDGDPPPRGESPVAVAGGGAVVRDWPAVMGRIASAVREGTAGLPKAASGGSRGRGPVGRPATTLTVAVVPAAGPGRAVCAAVGDSPAVRLSGGDWHVLVGTPAKDAMYENVTPSLPGGSKTLQVKEFDWVTGELLILTSDGFHDGLADGRDGFARDVAGRWRRPPGMLAFLRDVDYRASGYNDDRTVLAVWGGMYDGGVP
ncbi:protein phosphatase 2C domain-containing protein [Sphaerisporangium aureirubrum]|uniref:Protein phosphatase 2C domain-containing protein n=1 Tax=Sphaerisporangium aureirubrum TaxID=1544736 RepID=A0ABW1NA22_9ACTN